MLKKIYKFKLIKVFTTFEGGIFSGGNGRIQLGRGPTSYFNIQVFFLSLQHIDSININVPTFLTIRKITLGLFLCFPPTVCHPALEYKKISKF